MNTIDYSLFEQAIEKHNVRSRWKDTLFPTTEDEKETIAESNYQKAKETYTRMIVSSKNDYSASYYRWALGESLGITPTKARYRPYLDRRKS